MRISRRKFLSGIVAGGLLAGSLKIEDTVDEGLNSQDVTVIGHRGFSELYKDNSMEGFKAANRIDADGVEIDVRVTADNRLILNHDPFIVGYEDQGLISNMKYSKLNNADSKIVLLDDFLDWFKQTDMKVYIDFKNPNGIEPTITKIREHDLSHRTVLLSLFPPHFELFPNDMETALAGSVTSRILLERMDGINPDYVIPHYTPFTEINNKEVRDKINGYWLFSEKEEDVINVLSEDPSVVLSNRPDIVLEKISSNNPQNSQ